MEENINKAFSEVYMILKLLDEELKNKVPDNIVEFIDNERDKSYIPVINPNIEIEKQNLMVDTINIMAVLKVKYWCKDKEEKQRVMEIINKNENTYREKQRKEYDVNNIFNKKKTNDGYNVRKEIFLIERKKTWYEKIFLIFRKIFKT